MTTPFDVSVTPTNTVIVYVDDKFFADQQFEAQLFAKAEEIDDVENIIVSEEESRVMFVYIDKEAAIAARTQLHNLELGPSNITYDTSFGPEAILASHTHHHHLQVPAPTKQFLISPPASPPIGWAPAPEEPPVIANRIIDRLGKPNVPHEIHPATLSTPSISVTHIEECSSGNASRRASQISSSGTLTPVQGPTAADEQLVARFPPMPVTARPPIAEKAQLLATSTVQVSPISSTDKPPQASQGGSGKLLDANTTPQPCNRPRLVPSLSVDGEDTLAPASSGLTATHRPLGTSRIGIPQTRRPPNMKRQQDRSTH